MSQNMNNQWEIVSPKEWKVTTLCLKYYDSKYKKYKAEVENFGPVTRSRAEKYKELENKMNFNRRKLDKHAKRRRNQMDQIIRATEDATEFGVVFPAWSLSLDNGQDLAMIRKILDQAWDLKMSGHELALYEGRGELMHCLEDKDENLVTRRQFRRG